MYKKKRVLDQKLIRENPTYVEESLSLRGKFFNINQIHALTLKKKEIDIELSTLQSESKKLSKSICSFAVLDKGTNSETALIKTFSISSLFSENEMCIPSITACSSSAPENPSVLSIMVESGKL